MFKNSVQILANDILQSSHTWLFMAWTYYSMDFIMFIEQTNHITNDDAFI